MTRGNLRQRIAVLLGSLVLVLAGVSPAAAATQSRTIGLSYHGSATPAYSFAVRGFCDECVPDLFGHLFLGSGSWAYGFVGTASIDQIHWDATALTAINFNDTLLRQGQVLDASAVLTPSGGTIVATGSVNGSAGLLNDPTGGTTFADPDGPSTAHAATWTFSNCSIPLPGDSPRSCVSNTQNISVGAQTVAGNVALGDLQIGFSVRLRLEASIGSDGVIAARSVTFVGSPGTINRTLTFAGASPSTLADPISLPCTQPAGSDVVYGLDASDYTPTTTIAGLGALHATAQYQFIVGDPVEFFGTDLTSINAPASSELGLTLNGDAGNATLGTLGKNLIPPTPDAGGGATHEYIGDQGSPIDFDGSATTSPCGFPTLRWDFSDGGVAFGKSPKHTFTGSGIYSGLLTATDVTGLSATQTFSVQVFNLAPRVDAGADTTEAWGRPLAFNGQAVDPGLDDQSTLTYQWRFGDGTPSATSGPSVSHGYATPGTYTAMFTACDRLGACDSDTRDVVIRARDVSVGSIGDTAATFDTGAHLRTSLVDEFGQAVNGRTVTFTIDGAAAGSAVTNSTGVGSTAWTPWLDAGLHATAASFAGDSLYTAASGGGNVTIARKATTTTYTGTLTGGANKTITLTAVLVDATGTPLAGRTIAFRLGTQTASAVTTASGVASVQLKLTQKNGTYPLTATWTPASAADTSHYLGSAASATFKLQAR